MISSQELKNSLTSRTGLVYLSLIVLVILSNFLVPGSVNRYTIPITLRRTGVLGIVAIGQTLVLLGGGTRSGVGLDLSIGALVFSTLVLGSTLIMLGFSGVTVVMVCFLVGLGWGALNGTLSTKLGIPPMVATWAVSLILMGEARLLGNAVPAPDFIRNVAGGQVQLGVLNIPYPFIALIIVAAIGYFLLQRTSYGRRLYAKSNNFYAAEVSGVRTDLITISTYVLSGFLTVISAFFAWGIQGSPTMSYTDVYTFPSLAGAIIGGTGFGTGRGGVLGTVAGAFIMRFMFSILSRLGLKTPQQSILQGIILIAIVSIYAFRK